MFTSTQTVPGLTLTHRQARRPSPITGSKVVQAEYRHDVVNGVAIGTHTFPAASGVDDFGRMLADLSLLQAMKKNFRLLLPDPDRSLRERLSLSLPLLRCRSPELWIDWDVSSWRLAGNPSVGKSVKLSDDGSLKHIIPNKELGRGLKPLPIFIIGLIYGNRPFLSSGGFLPDMRSNRI